MIYISNETVGNQVLIWYRYPMKKDVCMNDFLLHLSKQHAPHMPDSYHEYTVWLMRHMLSIREKQKLINEKIKEGII